jgi:hypothetical protein
LFSSSFRGVIILSLVIRSLISYILGLAVSILVICVLGHTVPTCQTPWTENIGFGFTLCVTSDIHWAVTWKGDSEMRYETCTFSSVVLMSFELLIPETEIYSFAGYIIH